MYGDERLHAMGETGVRTPAVLLVDEDPGDVGLIELALARTRRHVQLHRVSNVSAALKFLQREVPYEDAPGVDLVMLNLQLPPASGPACLTALRSDPANPLPVVALLSATDGAGVESPDNLGASAVIPRPRGLHDLVSALDSTLEFFLGTASLTLRSGGA